MSALEVYLAPNSESSYTCFLTTIAIIVFVGWTQMKIHLMYAGELDRFSIAFDKRMSALEGVAKELSATESAHGVLLKEHGEDISLAAETAYRAAGLPNANEPHPRNREPPFHSRIQYVVDEPIQKFLRRSPKKTVREILSHLSHDEAAQTEWKRHATLEMTLHDVNSRLYSLLAQTIIQKDDSVARPLWSLTTLGLQRLHFSERQGSC